MKKLNFKTYFDESFFPISVTEMTMKNNDGQTVTSIHSHGFSEIVFLADGTLSHHCNGITEKLKKGSFLLIHPEMEHYYSGITPTTLCYNILYDSSIPIPILIQRKSFFLHQLYPEKEDIQAGYSGFSGRVPPKQIELILALIQNIQQENRRHRSGFQIMIISYFTAIATLLSRYAKEEKVIDSNWSLSKVIGMMRGSCHDSTVTIADFAKASGMCQRTLLRKFKASFGIGPMQYLQKLRVELAVKLLENMAFSLDEVAIKSGFYNYSHMWRGFRKHLNCTPAEVRSHKKEN